MPTRRNDRCPCGSGKKYKRCHGLTSEQRNEIGERQDLAARSNTLMDLNAYASEATGDDTLLDAWYEWHLGDPPPFDDESPDAALFGCWSIFDFMEYEEASEENGGIAWPLPSVGERFFQDPPRALSALERAYLKSAIDSPLSFFEILEVKKGESFAVRNLLSGEEHLLREKGASQEAEPGMVFFGKVVSFGSGDYLEAASEIFFPVGAKLEVLRFKEEAISEMTERDSEETSAPEFRAENLTYDEMIELEIDTLALYHDLRDSYLEGPILTNTDGDLLEFHKLTFEVKDADAAFDRLHSLDLNETREEILGAAEVDADGKWLTITFPWLKKGSKAHGGADANTVIAQLRLTRERLTVEVNSRERAAKARRKITKLAGAAVREQLTLVEPAEAKLTNEEMDAESSSLEELPEEFREEVQAAIREMSRKHLESWPNQKLPALGNKTPRQALKTPTGREMVVTILKDFERSARDQPDADFQIGLIRKIWEDLKLSREE